MSAWVLPDHIADALPSEARHIETLRRLMLDTACVHGYELVIPPLLEHLDSLLTGTGQALDLQTFKLVDQLSGRTLGLRADTTQQVARIDAHLLNRAGVTRLCYCGPVLHTRPARPYASREPLQFGAEIYGHAGPQSDLESLLLAVECLRAVQVQRISVDLTDARILRTVLQNTPLNAQQLQALHQALAVKDGSEIKKLSASLPQAQQRALCALPDLYGDAQVLRQATQVLSAWPELGAVLDKLQWLAGHLTDVQGVSIGFDLADMRGYAYYSGARFAMFTPGASDALVRGGRYDEVGAVFGRNRPAVGFSLDLRELVRVVPAHAAAQAIHTTWCEDEAWRSAVAQLRAQGHVVVCALPGDECGTEGFQCDRQLQHVNGQWVVVPLVA